MNHHHGFSSGVKGQDKGCGSFQIQIPPEPAPPLSLSLLRVLHGTTEQENSNAPSSGCLDNGCCLDILIIPSPAFSPSCWDDEVGSLVREALDINRGCLWVGREAPYGLLSFTHPDSLSPDTCLGSHQKLFQIGLCSSSVFLLKCCPL